jgi:hypothetical protein
MEQQPSFNSYVHYLSYHVPCSLLVNAICMSITACVLVHVVCIRVLGRGCEHCAMTAAASMV